MRVTSFELPAPVFLLLGDLSEGTKVPPPCGLPLFLVVIVIVIIIIIIITVYDYDCYYHR